MPFNKATEGSLQDQAKKDPVLRAKIQRGRWLQAQDQKHMRLWAKNGFVSAPEPSRGSFKLDDLGGWDKIG